MTHHYAISETFGIEAPGHLTIEGLGDGTHPRIPPIKDYVFRREALRDVLAFLECPEGDGLFVTGPTGSGKTSLLVQVAARLKWPMHAVTCHGHMELSDLIGQFTLVNGEMAFVHGPLVQAMRDGHILLLNETDLMNPSELAGLNDCLEGQSLVIPQNGGEIIAPHPRFRLVATGNSRGAGDQSGLYQGVLRQNLAWMDRFRLLEIDYPEKAIEMALLERLVPAIPSTIREKMIRVAGEIRTLFAGGLDGTGILSITLSTRGLIRWAHLTVAFNGAPNALAYALDRALTLRAEPEQRIAIHRIAADVFGLDWDPLP